MQIDRRVCLRADSLHRFEKRHSYLRESATKKIIIAADGYFLHNKQIGRVGAGLYGADYADLHTGIACAHGHSSLQSSTASLWQG
jgi:hypothetical protein